MQTLVFAAHLSFLIGCHETDMITLTTSLFQPFLPESVNTYCKWTENILVQTKILIHKP